MIMKELSIEEKAKAYDEALERAKKVNKGEANDREPGTSICEYIFPELKEGEDERAMRDLLNFLKSPFVTEHICDWKVAPWIAWLEKQGGIYKLSEEEQNRLAKVVQTSCAMSFIDYLDAHKYDGKMCVSNGECEDIENAFHNAMWDRLHRYYCKYIEKQGEKSLTVDIESMIEAYEQRLINQSNGVRNSPIVNMCVAAFKHGVENTLDELHLKQGEQKHDDEKMKDL